MAAVKWQVGWRGHRDGRLFGGPWLLGVRRRVGIERGLHDVVLLACSGGQMMRLQKHCDGNMFKVEVDLHVAFVPPMTEHRRGIILTRSIELPFPPSGDISILETRSRYSNAVFGAFIRHLAESFELSTAVAMERTGVYFGAEEVKRLPWVSPPEEVRRWDQIQEDFSKISQRRQMAWREKLIAKYHSLQALTNAS